MKNVRLMKSQAGFSLVELMVVVAIIGILASLAIPSIGKYMAKARQSEAKTQLASLYTAEKAFYAEYTQFDSRFGAIGYSPEGKLRYNVGFAGSVVASTYTVATLTATQSMFATLTYCPAVTGSVIVSTATGCGTLPGATNSPPPAVSAAAVIVNTAGGASTLVGEAVAVVHSAGGSDVWQITENKDLRNTTNGIP
jgi:type IV pilus assembly protein PilA